MSINADLPEIPPIVQAWVLQLTDPSFLALMRTWPAEQVDVKLTASRGRVRRRPEIVFNGGPQDLIEP